MLVLSRRTRQRVRFPDLDISVEVLQVAGQRVRLGIEAPRHVEVMREELLELENRLSHEGNPRVSSEPLHQLRNRLNAAMLRLQLVERKLARGEFDPADPTWSWLQAEIPQLGKTISTGSDKKSGPRHTAIVVDDDVNEAELLAGYLRLCNFEVTTIYDGQAALDYMHAHERPDVVLMDMRMPRLGGLEAISAIRRHPDWKRARIYAVTGSTLEEIGVKTIDDVGVDGWLTKPLRPELLVAELNQNFVAA
jgi:carbon storage regulator CsrA